MSEKTASGMIPIHKTDIYREVITRINQIIDEGSLRPGDRLPSERVLAEQLGVSRTSVRQGIKVLESIGRLETRVGSGTFICQDQVPQISIQDIDINRKGLSDLIAARIGIETTVLRVFFATARSEENMLALESIHREAEKARDAEKHSRNSDKGFRYNFRFEEAIAAMTENKILILQQQQIHALWAYMWGRLGFLPRNTHGLAQHAAILSAIQENECELACINMRRHVERDLDILFPSPAAESNAVPGGETVGDGTAADVPAAPEHGTIQ